MSESSSALRERYQAVSQGHWSAAVKDLLTGELVSGHEGPLAMVGAEVNAGHLNTEHMREVRRAHEEALAYHLRLFPPPSTRYQAIVQGYHYHVLDTLEQRVVARGMRGVLEGPQALAEGIAWAQEIAARLNKGDTRRADHERRKARYGVCRSWRIHWERWRPVISRCCWPADHVEFTKWHCSEDTTGRVWLVGEDERREF